MKKKLKGVPQLWSEIQFRPYEWYVVSTNILYGLSMLERHFPKNSIWRMRITFHRVNRKGDLHRSKGHWEFIYKED